MNIPSTVWRRPNSETSRYIIHVLEHWFSLKHTQPEYSLTVAGVVSGAITLHEMSTPQSTVEEEKTLLFKLVQYRLET